MHLPDTLKNGRKLMTCERSNHWMSGEHNLKYDDGKNIEESNFALLTIKREDSMKNCKLSSFMKMILG